VEQCFEKLRRRCCYLCSALCGCFVSGNFKMQENAVYRYLAGFGQAVSVRAAAGSKSQKANLK
jgi:hypothetical protein